MNCSKLISQSIGSEDCAPIVKGYKSRAWLINLDDIDTTSLTYGPDNIHILSGISLKTGKYGYAVMQRGSQPFSGTNSAMAQGTYQNDVTKTVNVVVPKDAATVNGVAQPMANGAEVVIILESKSKGADGQSAFEIIGLDGGLVATAYTDDIYGDPGKNILFTLTETTTNVATFVFNTDYEATKVMIEGLLRTLSDS